MKRLLLLKTGDPPPLAATTYDELFGVCLGADTLAVADARLDELPGGPWAGIVITGSAFSTYEDLPWIASAEQFLREQAALEVPLYGVCFGHQLLAQAFGGKVEPCPDGWELGTCSIELTGAGVADPLFASFPRLFQAQQSHADVVTALPAGATVLATNQHWGVQAFRLGPRIWGTQFHPEFTRATMEAAIGRVTPLLGENPFPQRPAEMPVEEWLAGRLEETPVARACLPNFAALALATPSSS